MHVVLYQILTYRRKDATLKGAGPKKVVLLLYRVTCDTYDIAAHNNNKSVGRIT